MATDRIQKILARAGLASRREAEKWIAEGLVTVNGKVAVLGEKADSSKDHIKVKGKLMKPSFEPLYFLFHKPRGVISMVTEDPQGRPSIKDYLPVFARKVFPVGRLQFNEEGLVLLTNDGDFSEALLKNRDVARVYEIKLSGLVSKAQLEDLMRGTRLEGKRVAPRSVRVCEWLPKGARVELVFQGPGAVDLKTLALRKGLSMERAKLRAIGQLKIERLAPGKVLALKRSQVEALLHHPELGLAGSEEGLQWLENRESRGSAEKAPVVRIAQATGSKSVSDSSSLPRPVRPARRPDPRSDASARPPRRGKPAGRRGSSRPR